MSYLTSGLDCRVCRLKSHKAPEQHFPPHLGVPMEKKNPKKQAVAAFRSVMSSVALLLGEHGTTSNGFMVSLHQILTTVLSFYLLLDLYLFVFHDTLWWK